MKRVVAAALLVFQDGCGGLAPAEPDAGPAPCGGQAVGDSCYTGPPGTAGVGVCRAGTSRCVDDLVVCQGEVTPQPFICNYADNDCNGMIDVDIPDAEVLAVCSSPACVGASFDQPITCWGSDYGMCGAGVMTCGGHGGERTGCAEFVGQGVPEVCNGFDDDCNGLIDDGLALGACWVGDGATWPADADPAETGVVLGQCRHGEVTCVDSCPAVSSVNWGRVCSASVECLPSQPSPEVCNGLDDDCDGMVDDHACATASDVASGRTFCCATETDGGKSYACAAVLGSTCLAAGP